MTRQHPHLTVSAAAFLLIAGAFGCTNNKLSVVDDRDDGTGSADTGESEGPVLAPSRTYCADIEAKLAECGLLSEGTFGCIEPFFESSLCYFDCLLAAPCEALQDLLCGPFYDSDLERCSNACFDLDPVICGDGRDRVSESMVCDGERDCEDGSDEVGCVDFVCDSGDAIPEAWVCDFYDDCVDGADEAGCQNGFPCGDGARIPESWQCDAEVDCEDGADEVGCPTFECEDGESIPAVWECDYVPDCGDLSDEVGCLGIACGSGETIPEAWVCDLEQDCADGSDEVDCGAFTCDDGYVIPTMWECDGEADCLDGSDEHDACARILCE